MDGNLTCHPHHDENLCPGEARGLDPEDLQGVVGDGHVGHRGDALEAVRGVEHQQAQKDDEGAGVRHKLHEGTAEHLSQLCVCVCVYRRAGCVCVCVCVYRRAV